MNKKRNGELNWVGNITPAKKNADIILISWLKKEGYSNYDGGGGFCRR